MLRKLLQDRLGLATHRVTQQRNGYELVLAKGGVKLHKASGEPPPMPDYFKKFPVDALNGRVMTTAEGRGIAAITGRGVPVAKLAGELSEMLRTFVVDRTGLAGDYYFGFTFAREVGAAPAEEFNAPELFDVLQRELGLKLESTKGPVEILVVDRVEKSPTAN